MVSQALVPREVPGRRGGVELSFGGFSVYGFPWHLRDSPCILANSGVFSRVDFKRGSFLGVWLAVAAFRAGSLDCRVAVCGCVVWRGAVLARLDASRASWTHVARILHASWTHLGRGLAMRVMSWRL